MRSQSSRRNAPRSRSDSERATITFPIHPFRGVAFAVVRMVGGTQRAPGVEHVDLQVTDGRVLRVPSAWTDLRVDALTRAPVTTSRVSAAVLLMLADLLEGRKLDARSRARSMLIPEQMVSPSVEPTSRQRVVGAVRSRGTEPRAVAPRGSSASTAPIRGRDRDERRRT